MVKHTQTIRRHFADKFLSVFDHFVGLALYRLKVRIASLDLEIQSRIMTMNKYS